MCRVHGEWPVGLKFQAPPTLGQMGGRLLAVARHEPADVQYSVCCVVADNSTA